MKILFNILKYKRNTINVCINKLSLKILRKGFYSNKEQFSNNKFIKSIKNKQYKNQTSIIAEIKRCSPSKGIITETKNIEKLALNYFLNGAVCISILTEKNFFKGSKKYILTVKKLFDIPILFKDFIIDEYQVFEARLLCTDCILLIVSILKLDLLKKLYNLALSIGLDVLLEIHNLLELEVALFSLNAKFIGINNRNLYTFNTSINITISLLKYMPSNVVFVTESGILNVNDFIKLQMFGVNVFLIGEFLLSNNDIFLRTLLDKANKYILTY
ncbi:Indole-3-glycerol phosphate synthase [Candidatus Portiera aleyrodidarum BT-B-HRs]|uniref:indole-3-glycerol phosphate synthase TrpC n=1 Tax=Candidatus Portiera aleyrodidarum TaxID=91844 RepID=UPI00027B2FFA|nr:indole-3-glycerol phosphate synthase TrpC [Candidatus Portiera aleyrodidarum]AFQ24196.1 Indole-3-glycerol phosphate synthase [Candidatus Portiera aleyrodidarum BT-B-HRs]AFT80885.1 Indole-3-glycerol phosphate synthase [Candidatus Portiera aleyrodidarum BT-B-HRs]ASX27245.1 indole-3-glycerol phosphate synthase [Candidatus Portiera aleyrodidarum MED (Bemisia tabaci)]